MGIALPLLSAPFQTLSHWLRQSALLESARQPVPAPQHGAAAAHQRPPGASVQQRPPRGNWPFTVKPPPAPADHVLPATQTTKVLRQSGTGRMVIAGRMADVCAELDRLAASEAIQV